MLERVDFYPRLSKEKSVLERIAASLDCSVLDFSETTSSNLTQTAELLGMWLMIENEQDRLKVLACIRNVASATAASKRR